MKKIIIAFTLLTPILSHAQLGQTRNILGQVDFLVGFVIPIAFSLALLFFFWGVAKYILSVGSEKEQGKQIMVWGVIALFVMASIWGLVRFIQGEFNITNTQSIPVPTFDGALGR
jgi:uncharacterized membrane protein HdeD (DUF308 family)